MGEFSKILIEHESLMRRESASRDKLDDIKREFNECDDFDKNDLQVFCAGSLGRFDIGTKSDLDLFAISNRSSEKRSKLEDLEVLAKLISLNRKLKYPPFSNDGQFLKIHSIDELKMKVGEPTDDSENLFTTRMLMLLESQPLYNPDLYNDHMKQVVLHYLRDKDGYNTFKPIFIINDLLRYWRTLCLNYELIRNDPERNWRKKNINLKFSRALTVFSAVLVLMRLEDVNESNLLKMFSMTPMRRLAFGLDSIDDKNMLMDYESILNDYESFLRWKEDEEIDEQFKKKDRDHAKVVASRFSDYLYKALTHETNNEDLKKVLIV